MENIWNKIELFLADNSPLTLKSLNPGLTIEQILLFEKKFNITLSTDYKDSLLLHNGQEYESRKHFIVVRDSYWLLPLTEMMEECNYRINILKLKSIDSLPIAKAGSGDCIYLNISDNKDKYGKINFHSHDGGAGNLSNSFKDFMEILYSKMIKREFNIDKDGWFELQ